jgi:hypothetical protein
MAGIRTTGNDKIDTATAEIAITLRNAWPGKRDQTYYDEAMRLRDEILAGAIETLDEPGKPAEWVVAYWNAQVQTGKWGPTDG